MICTNGKVHAFLLKTNWYSSEYFNGWKWNCRLQH